VAISENTTGLPATPNKAERDFLLKDVDCTGLSEEEKNALAAVLWEDFLQSTQSTNYKPQRVKIIKETQMFATSLGTSLDELRGVLIARQTTRGYWPKGSTDKKPLCSSLDGKIGHFRGEDGSVQDMVCAACEFNEFGSAMDEYGNALAGKACKEMRRLYILEPGAIFPSYISLPPTSLNIWDNFISARLNAGISDIKQQVVLGLETSSNGKFSYSVIKPKNGAVLKPLDIVEVSKIAKKYKADMLNLGVEVDDYMPDGAPAVDAPSADSDLGATDEPPKGKKSGKPADEGEPPF